MPASHLNYRRLSVFDCVAVVGATGAVGTIIRELLEARKFPFQNDEVRGLGPLGGQEDPVCRAGDHGRGVEGPGLRRRGPGHQQHARRRGPRLHSRRRPPRLRGDRRERLLADGPERAAGDSRGQRARDRAGTRASSPAPTARPRRWSRPSSRCTTPAASAAWS